MDIGPVTCTEPGLRTGTLSQLDKWVFGMKAEPEDVLGVFWRVGKKQWKTKAVCEVTERCQCH